MKRWAVGVALGLVLATLGGCASRDVEPGEPSDFFGSLFGRRYVAGEVEKLSDQQRQGYGVTNDNADRQRQGLPLKNY